MAKADQALNTTESPTEAAEADVYDGSERDADTSSDALLADRRRGLKEWLVDTAPEDDDPETGDEEGEPTQIAAPGEEDDAQASEQTAEEAEGEADDKPVPFHEHPRWKQLNEQKKAAEDQSRRILAIVNETAGTDFQTLEEVESAIAESKAREAAEREDEAYRDQLYAQQQVRYDRGEVSAEEAHRAVNDAMALRQREREIALRGQRNDLLARENAVLRAQMAFAKSPLADVPGAWDRIERAIQRGATPEEAYQDTVEFAEKLRVHDRQAAATRPAPSASVAPSVLSSKGSQVQPPAVVQQKKGWRAAIGGFK